MMDCLFSDNISEKSKTLHSIAMSTIMNLTPHCELASDNAQDHQLGEFRDAVISAIKQKKINKDIGRIVLKLSRLSFTKNVLNSNEAMQIVVKLKQMEKEGLYTCDTIMKIKKLVEKFYIQHINMNEFHKYLGELRNIGDTENYAKKVKQNIFYLYYPNRVKYLAEQYQMSEEILNEIKELEKGKHEIQDRLFVLKSINIPGIIEFVKFLEELGLLSDLVLSNLRAIVCNMSNLTGLIDEQQDRINVSLVNVNDLIEKYTTELPNTENCIERKREPHIHDMNTSSCASHNDKLSSNIDKHSKGRISLSEQNAPLCVDCGGWKHVMNSPSSTLCPHPHYGGWKSDMNMSSSKLCEEKTPSNADIHSKGSISLADPNTPLCEDCGAWERNMNSSTSTLFDIKTDNHSKDDHSKGRICLSDLKKSPICVGWKHDMNKTSSKMYAGKQSIKADKHSKGRICLSDHNTPFCKNCGWKTFWVKAFKRKGVYIKEADRGNMNNIWE